MVHVRDILMVTIGEISAEGYTFWNGTPYRVPMAEYMLTKIH